MKYTLFIYLLLLVLPVHSNEIISKDSCRNISKQFEMLTNFYVASDTATKEAHRILPILKRGETPNYYYIVYNIFIERLFNNGKINEARQEIDRMTQEAQTTNDNECLAITHRTQGQFYYKLGLYRRAQECFRNGMAVCPDYKELRSYFTYSSTLTWLVETDLHLGEYNEAARLLQKMDEMLVWMNRTERTDRSGYTDVRCRALKVIICLRTGKIEEADRLLRECESFMHPELPVRAYIDYYVAHYEWSGIHNKHEQALQYLDTLISNHEGFLPIKLDFIHRRAELLTLLNRSEESCTAYRQFIEGKDSIDRIAIAEQLDELRTQYKVSSYEQEIYHIKTQRIWYGVLLVILLISSFFYIRYTYRLRQKNCILVRQIQEADTLRTNKILHKVQQEATGDIEVKDKDYRLFEQLNSYLQETKEFTNSELDRKKLAGILGTNDTYLSNAIKTCTGATMLDYLNTIRLEYSRMLLKETADVSISQIATECGFGSLRTYQRLFKEKYGLTPSQYRNISLRNK